MASSASPVRSTALELLARQASEVTLGSVPEVVRRQARLCLLDTVGCMIAGTRTEEARLVLDCEPSEQGEPTATIPGTTQRRSLLAAVRVNGYLGDALELNDLIGGHASIANVTAALALAETIDAPGAALLEAVIRGIEVTSRIYAAVYPTLKRFTEVGIAPIGIPSTIGSAAAAARLLNLDAGQTLHAMAIAGGLAGWCPAEAVFGSGGTLKPYLFGSQPGATGITAAFYARRGMTGPLRLLDGKLGYFATSSSGGQLDAAGAAGRWALARPRRKLHACCGYLHSALDAMGKLRAQMGGAIGPGAVEIRVPPYVADVVSKRLPPVSANDARFHLQYCVALAMCGEDVIRPEHSIEFRSHLARAEVAAAAEQIGVVAEPELTHYHQCRIVVHDSAGRRHETSLAAPRGSPDEPLTDQDVVAKFVRLAGPVTGLVAARGFAGAVAGLEEVESTRRLMRLVASRAAAVHTSHPTMTRRPA